MPNHRAPCCSFAGWRRALGTRSNIKVVLVRTFQIESPLVRNISYGSSRDQMTWYIAIIS